MRSMPVAILCTCKIFCVQHISHKASKFLFFEYCGNPIVNWTNLIN